jgi:hypothetical protein
MQKKRLSGRVRAKGKDKPLIKLQARMSAYERGSAEFKASAVAPGTRKKVC